MAARKPQRRREFGTVRQLPSGRWQTRYWAPDGSRRTAPETFSTRTDAQTWLTLTQADIERKHWVDPDAGAVNFAAYAVQWVEERGLSATTEELYRRLLRLHLLPTFASVNLDDITPPGVRTWRAERLEATGATTVAKSYRLLKAIMETAADDELIRRNPCRIRGAGSERAKERPTATVEQVDALADAMGPRWRLMVYFGAYGPMRPEEQAALRRPDVTLEPLAARISDAAPELTTGRRVEGDTKSTAGRRTVFLPAFLRIEVKRHLDWYAEKEPNGLLFVGERGAPFRRSTFGRKWRRARTKVGLPEDFRFYDLRHTGHTLSTQSGATLKDTMVRAGQSSEKAALIYQHSDGERQREVAGGGGGHRRTGAGRTPKGQGGEPPGRAVKVQGGRQPSPRPARVAQTCGLPTGRPHVQPSSVWIALRSESASEVKDAAEPSARLSISKVSVRRRPSGVGSRSSSSILATACRQLSMLWTSSACVSRAAANSASLACAVKSLGSSDSRPDTWTWRMSPPTLPVLT